MMRIPATTSPTVSPIIVFFSIPLSSVSFAPSEANVARVSVADVVDEGLVDDVVSGEETGSSVTDEVDNDKDEDEDENASDSLATAVRLMYQLVLQKPSILCSSSVPWALPTLKTKGLVKLVSSARTSHWYH